MWIVSATGGEIQLNAGATGLISFGEGALISTVTDSQLMISDSEFTNTKANGEQLIVAPDAQNVVRGTIGEGD